MRTSTIHPSRGHFPPALIGSLAAAALFVVVGIVVAILLSSPDKPPGQVVADSAQPSIRSADLTIEVSSSESSPAKGAKDIAANPSTVKSPDSTVPSPLPGTSEAWIDRMLDQERHDYAEANRLLHEVLRSQISSGEEFSTLLAFAVAGKKAGISPTQAANDVRTAVAELRAKGQNPAFASQIVTDMYIQRAAVLSAEASKPAPVDDSETPVAEFVREVGGVVLRDNSNGGNSITTVSFFGTKVSDADLLPLMRLRNLQYLDLRGTLVTDAGIQPLSSLRTILGLQLSNTAITDAGLRDILHLKKLQVLEMSRTQITDDGLKGLEQLEQLKDLTLSNTRVSDIGLSYIGKCRNLERLNLAGTSVTGTGFKNCGNLAGLKHLNLNLSEFSDVGLKELKGLTGLEEVWLRETNVTNSGIRQLSGLKRLKQLNLDGTQVTDDGVQRLQKDLPNLQITR